MSKQTATEWLFKKLWDEPKDKLTWYAILKQAEEMFEEQIVEAHFEGQYDKTEGYPIKIAEQYYNETFKK